MKNGRATQRDARRMDNVPRGRPRGTASSKKANTSPNSPARREKEPPSDVLVTWKSGPVHDYAPNDPLPAGCDLCVFCVNEAGQIYSKSFEYNRLQADLWIKLYKPNIIRWVAEVGITWERQGKLLCCRMPNNSEETQLAVVSLTNMLLAEEASGPAALAYAACAMSNAIIAGRFPHARPAILAHKALTKSGEKRGRQLHGVITPSDIHDWKGKMAELCSTPGMTRSKAWSEMCETFGRKRETLEKNHIICSIPPRRGRWKKKSTP